MYATATRTTISGTLPPSAVQVTTTHNSSVALQKTPLWSHKALQTWAARVSHSPGQEHEEGEVNHLAPSDQAPATTAGTNVDQAPQSSDSMDTDREPELYGFLSRSIRGPLTFQPWWLKDTQEPVMIVNSPPMDATGTVIADNRTVNVAEYEIGFMQIVVEFSATATYIDQEGHEVQHLKFGLSREPIRDSERGSKPWMKQKDVKPLDSHEGYIVSTDDQPQIKVFCRTEDRRGRLSKLAGKDIFCTWLAARHKPTSKMYCLAWGMWTVDYGSEFDAPCSKGRSTGTGGQVGPEGGKRGPLKPLEGDPVANDSNTLEWSAIQ